MNRLVVTAYLLIVSVVVHGQYQLSGTVTIENVPAIGAAVELGEYGNITDLDGKFSITDIAAGHYTMTVSYLGAESHTESLVVSANISDIKIDLKTKSETIDQIVVTAKSQKRIIETQALLTESVDITKLSSSIKDMTEAIDQLSGVRVRSSGSLGAASDISLNGLNGSAVRTYIDGLPMEFLYPNTTLSNLPLNDVKRIDVYKGVLPVQVGTDAMGGGINIIPAYKSINSLRASYGLGSYNTHQLAVNGSLATGKNTSVYASASHARSDNNYTMNAYVWEDAENKDIKRFHDEYRFSRITGGAVIQNKSWTDFLRVNLSYSDYFKELQHGGLIKKIALGEPIYKGHITNGLVEYKKNINENIRFKNAVSYSIGRLNYVDTSAVRYSWSGKKITTSRRGEFRQASNSKRNQYGWVNRTGIDLRLSQGWSVSLANIYARQRFNGRDVERPIKRDILQHDQSLTKNVAGIEIKASNLINKLELTAAIKHYYFVLDAVDFRAFSPISKDDQTYGYYTTAKYTVTKDFFVRSSYEKAYRIPTYEQFFGNGINIIPNPILKPESSHNYNLGIAYRTKVNDDIMIQAEANGFVRNQRDIIFLNPAVLSQYINAEQVQSKGIELELSTTLWDRLTIQTNYTQLAKTYVTISEKNISSKFLEGTPFPNTPSLFGNARIEYRVRDLFIDRSRLSLYTQYKYVKEYNYINVGKIRNDSNWIPTQHRVDAGVNYSLEDGKYNVSFNINNVLNRELYDNYRIPRPRRNYNIKLIYQITNF